MAIINEQAHRLKAAFVKPLQAQHRQHCSQFHWTMSNRQRLPQGNRAATSAIHFIRNSSGYRARFHSRTNHGMAKRRPGRQDNIPRSIKDKHDACNSSQNAAQPDNHSLLMIDHQYLQMLTIRSHNTSELINHAVALVEASAIFQVPLLTTTAFSERQGLVATLAEATRAVKPIDRTTLN
ncbi:MAG: hypothetical protein ABR971_06315 [Acidobacteriaceae bacterium]